MSVESAPACEASSELLLKAWVSFSFVSFLFFVASRRGAMLHFKY